MGCSVGLKYAKNALVAIPYPVGASILALSALRSSCPPPWKPGAPSPRCFRAGYGPAPEKRGKGEEWREKGKEGMRKEPREEGRVGRDDGHLQVPR